MIERGEQVKTGSEYIYAAISILCWGFSATISKLLLNSLDPYCTFAYACTFASLILLIWCGYKGKLSLLKNYSSGTVLRMLGIGVLGILIYNLCLLLGISRLPAQEAFVINYLWPAMIILFGCIILREKLTLGKAAAVIFSFIGIVVITTGGSESGGVSGDIPGIACCVIAAVSYGLYSVLNKRESYDKDLSVLLSYALSAAAGFALAAARGALVLPSPGQLAGLAVYGVFCDGVAYVTWLLAIDRGNTAVISNLAYMTPFISLVVTHCVLGEAITLYSVLGLALIIFGIILQFLTQHKYG